MLSQLLSVWALHTFSYMFPLGVLWMGVLYLLVDFWGGVREDSVSSYSDWKLPREGISLTLMEETTHIHKVRPAQSPGGEPGLALPCEGLRLLLPGISIRKGIPAIAP